MLNIKQKIAQVASLPKEVMLDLSVLTIAGRGEVAIENYKSLLEFSETQIRIRTKEGDVSITGTNLLLHQITSENLLITGRITGVLFG